jgi:hypothetical protein
MPEKKQPTRPTRTNVQKTMKHALNPLAEVFGFPVSNRSSEALRYQNLKLCPYNNGVPNCTKDKANEPLGVCSIIHENKPVITCPVRFRENWIIAEHAAEFIFPSESQWTTVSEVRLNDALGKSAGNIDYVLVSYTKSGEIIDFGSLEVQAVYISGNLRNAFEAFLKEPTSEFSWKGAYFPTPDYLSSSRKRLVPQLLSKGGILNYWKKKQVVALKQSFFDTLPPLPTVSANEATVLWLLYDLIPGTDNKLHLTLVNKVYTDFETTLEKVIRPHPGNLDSFINELQGKLAKKLETHSPDAPSLDQLLSL